MLNVLIKTNFFDNFWLLTAFYGNPYKPRKLESWEFLEDISSRIVHSGIPWVVIGDYNQVFSPSEKLGGLPFNSMEAEPFKRLFQRAGLSDIGFQGNFYTWNNYREANKNIQERLDKAYTNDEWNSHFPDSSLTHLPSFGSDHIPIRLDLFPFSALSQNYPFKFFDTWLKENSCMQLISQTWNPSLLNVTDVVLNNLKILGENLTSWRKNVFGVPEKKIKKLLQSIDSIQSSSRVHNKQKHLNQKLLDLENLYDTQEEIAKQLSRENFVNIGEINTKYFHLKTLKRRKRNQIDCLLNQNGEILKQKPQIAKELKMHFENLFTVSPTVPDQELMNLIPKVIYDQDNADLLRIPTSDEVWMVVKSMKSNKSSGPDVFPLNVSQRIKIFLWKCIHNALPVRKKLSEHMDDIDIKCIFCDHECESLKHLFFECPYAKSVALLPPVVGINHSSNLDYSFAQMYSNWIAGKVVPKSVRKLYRSGFTALHSLVARMKESKYTLSEATLEKIAESSYGQMFLMFWHTKYSESHWEKLEGAVKKYLKCYKRGRVKNELTFEFVRRGETHIITSTPEKMGVMFGTPRMAGRRTDDTFLMGGGGWRQKPFYIRHFGDSNTVTRPMLQDAILKLLKRTGIKNSESEGGEDSDDDSDEQVPDSEDDPKPNPTHLKAKEHRLTHLPLLPLQMSQSQVHIIDRENHQHL
ncbi:uncharacterized protein LOC113274788 [Papaver somniferum]|uniref:uncharacterized protein LOC113274788 n=1 Tax=Papaver somniferum TaxID=3469 RepID=UPI000E6FBF96|nr:uncharacterized protein LOC113274788 [Papaver somniferum]